jgi:predicted dienelactone hydrolase
MAAETISVTVGPLQRSLDVDDLETFVATGEVPRRLQWYAEQLTDRQLATLRQILQKPFAVDPRVIAKFARLPEGDALLRRLNVLFQTTDPEVTFKALRAALVLAAYDDGGLTAMNAIRQYPLRVIRVDLNTVLKAVSQATDLFINDNLTIAYIRNKAAAMGTMPRAFAKLPDWRQPGSFDWTKTTITFANPNRNEHQSILADIYLPHRSNRPAPLVVISHGAASDRTTFAYVARHLASYGFAVAAIEHPDTDVLRFQQYIAGFADPPPPSLFINRPLDITFLLDDLERRVTNDPNWRDRIRTERVGVLGQSLGGYTVLAAGGAKLDFDHLSQSCQDFTAEVLPFNLSELLQCRLQQLAVGDHHLQDRRIGAVLAVNPLTSSVFGPRGMGNLQLPLIVIAGNNDFIAPAVPEQVRPYTWAGSEDKYLAIVENGTHFSFLKGGEAGVVDLPQQVVGPNPTFAHPFLQGLSTVFFLTYIADNPDYKAYLATDFYLPSLESGPFSYVLTRSLTEAELEDAVLVDR